MEKYNNGFVCGAFDLFHAGHNILLQDCKSVCNFLIVGLQTDPTIDRENKNKPIQTMYERYVQLENCKHVDKIIPYDTEADLMNMLKTLKIDVRILGDDYKNTYYTGYELNIPIHFVNRSHNFSSTELRNRLKIKGN